MSSIARKPVFGDFRPGTIQDGLYKHRRKLEARNFGFTKKINRTTYVAEKALISCYVAV